MMERITELDYDENDFFDKEGWLRDDVGVAASLSGNVYSVDQSNKSYYEQGDYIMVKLDEDIQNSQWQFEKNIITQINQVILEESLQALDEIDKFEEAAIRAEFYVCSNENTVNFRKHFNLEKAKDEFYKNFTNKENPIAIKSTELSKMLTYQLLEQQEDVLCRENVLRVPNSNDQCNHYIIARNINEGKVVLEFTSAEEAIENNVKIEKMSDILGVDEELFQKEEALYSSAFEKYLHVCYEDEEDYDLEL